MSVFSDHYSVFIILYAVYIQVNISAKLDFKLSMKYMCCGPWLKKHQNQKKCVFHGSHQGFQRVQLTQISKIKKIFFILIFIFYGSHQGCQ